MAPKQLGTWVRYINSGLEEGEVKKCLGHVEVNSIEKIRHRHILGVDRRHKLRKEIDYKW
jgi:hypothetical protein